MNFNMYYFNVSYSTFHQCALFYIIVNISQCTDMEHVKYRMSMLLWLFHVNFIAYDTCIRREFEVHFLLLVQVILSYIRVPKCSVFLPDLDFLTDRATILEDTIKRTVLI
jgi:hypothetical protein